LDALLTINTDSSLMSPLLAGKEGVRGWVKGKAGRFFLNFP